MVSAWAGVNNIVLGQRKVNAKSNEITAIPELLKLLVLKGCIVTIDAMGCQKEIARAITDQEADYILSLNASTWLSNQGNQGNLLEQTEDSFRFLEAKSLSSDIDVGHGRVEHRVCSVIDNLSMVEQKDEWKNLRCLVKVEAERYMKSTGKSEKETRYYISSLPAEASILNTSIRSHWGMVRQSSPTIALVVFGMFKSG
jgi:predicted transposase YbfD/YdcC